jgi:hypothetical protein
MNLPEPGTGPFIRLTEVKAGTALLGLAPIGIRWRATMGRDGKIKPEGDCPRGEFLPTHAYVQGVWQEIKD